MVSCVAGAEGLEVVERQPDGTLGAAKNVPYSMPGAERPSTSLGQKFVWFIEGVTQPQPKALKKPGSPIPGRSMSFIATQADALNMVQGLQAGLPQGVGCFRLWKSGFTPSQVLDEAIDYMSNAKQQLIWDGCPKFPGQPTVYPPQQLY